MSQTFERLLGTINPDKDLNRNAKHVAKGFTTANVIQNTRFPGYVTRIPSSESNFQAATNQQPNSRLITMEAVPKQPDINKSHPLSAYSKSHRNMISNIKAQMNPNGYQENAMNIGSNYLDLQKSDNQAVSISASSNTSPMRGGFSPYYGMSHQYQRNSVVMSATSSNDVSEIQQQTGSEGMLQKPKEKKPTPYAWFVLFCVFFVRAIHQLHRQCIGFAFGYKGVGENAANPHYMISVAYPQMPVYYGLISSFVFSSSYSTLGVWAGVLSGKMSRKVLLGLSCIFWSATTYFAGAVPSFAFFCVMRFLLGGFESACNPASYSLIADYFPPSYRSTANAIETAGSYVGGGMASLSILLIKAYGWRVMYKVIGLAGILTGIASMVAIKEPGRGVFDFKDEFRQNALGDDSLSKGEKQQEEEVVKDTRGPIQQFKDALSQVWTNKTARYVTIAGGFRFWETFAIVYYLPSFFQKVFPLFKAEYGLYNAAVISCCGFISTVLGGILSDKFEKRSRMTKAWVCNMGSLLAIPAVTIATLVTGNFYVALGMFALKYMLSECWMSPAITMMQTTVPPEDQGSIVSAHLFYLTVVGCAATVSLGFCANLLGAATNPRIYGYLIWVWSMVGYIGSVPFFFKGGKKYKEYIENEEAEALKEARERDQGTDGPTLATA